MSFKREPSLVSFVMWLFLKGVIVFYFEFYRSIEQFSDFALKGETNGVLTFLNGFRYRKPLEKTKKTPPDGGVFV